ncbi:TetR/AcrR family transcriptional regulator [Pseudonocardia sp. H11422]|uniref:TetR/AcrR family transcriptional regulator n=1 Tax=Pseudonocardia sp. H11422 TaxID=2835866 RepID=UPI001BDCA40D|nr:TetR/AcrR family transcriptional regulator [Pseudonocardia sp. H11422]
MTAGPRTRKREGQAQRARATRRRIVSAATTLFVRDGYLQTTMADIAGEAGVAVQTLYLAFGSKVAVLAAAVDVTIAGDDEPSPVIEREWFRRLQQEPDGRRALGVFVDGATEIIERFYPLYAAVRAAATDPEPAELLDANKRMRFTTFEGVVTELATKPGFADGLGVRRGTEVLYALLSEETYGLLVAEHGWAVPGWSAWVHRHVGGEFYPA